MRITTQIQVQGNTGINLNKAQADGLWDAHPPRVWVVDAYRAGEQGQLLALAEALGWPFEIKRLRYKKWAARINLLRGTGLAGVAAEATQTLAAPWPDLVISAGMRNEPVCRWIRQQSDGKTRIVHVGRPWANPERFDLVITTPQYRLPERDNVLQNDLTLHRVSAAKLAEEAERWQAPLAGLPLPRVAVIVGGNSGPFTLGERAARRLAEQAAASVAERGGSLLVTTSSRTHPAVVEVLAGIDSVPIHFYHWQAGDEANPYFGYLALADEFIVTADSISMLSEACATGKPVYMFDLNVGKRAMRPPALAGSGDNDSCLSTFLYRGLMRWGWQRLSRDITLVHQSLVRSGRAAWLGERLLAKAGPQSSDIDRAVARVRELLASTAFRTES